MAELAISRLASRVLAPDIDAAWAAAPVLEQATRGLPAALAPLLDALG